MSEPNRQKTNSQVRVCTLIRSVCNSLNLLISWIDPEEVKSSEFFSTSGSEARGAGGRLAAVSTEGPAWARSWRIEKHSLKSIFEGWLWLHERSDQLSRKNEVETKTKLRPEYNSRNFLLCNGQIRADSSWDSDLILASTLPDPRYVSR